MSAKNRKIRNFLIHPQFQLRYVFFLNLIGILMFSTAATVVYLGMSHHLTKMIPDPAVLESVLSFSDVLPLLVGLGLFFVFAVSILGIYISHRTAGPLYRLKRSLLDVSAGNRELRIQLRQHDEFKEVADAFNQMMENLQNPDQ